MIGQVIKMMRIISITRVRTMIMRRMMMMTHVVPEL